jgi:hypothetical protein
MQTGTAKGYRCFTRTWWKHNDSGKWPNNLEPCPGRKTTFARHCTKDEARILCEQYNMLHKPGKLSKKAAFEEE